MKRKLFTEESDDIILHTGAKGKDIENIAIDNIPKIWLNWEKIWGDYKRTKKHIIIKKWHNWNHIFVKIPR